eukprot:g4329.t1
MSRGAELGGYHEQLQEATREAAVKAVDLRTELLELRLRSAKACCLLGDWSEAEALASRAIEAAMLGNDQQLRRELDMEDCAGGAGVIAHRDVLDAFLCRARARLRRGAAEDAAADAGIALAMAGQLQEHEKQESAQSFLIQAEMALGRPERRGTGPGVGFPSPGSGRKPSGADWVTKAEQDAVQMKSKPLPELSKMPKAEDLGFLNELD